MVLWCLQLSSCLVLLWVCSRGAALCPSMCNCRVTEKGRRKVSCTAGGMTDSIPTGEMDAGIEVLEISAPPDSGNSLSIGPVFQHFRRLDELRIRHSDVHQIGMHPFWGVPTLRTLDLAFNKIGQLVEHNFRGLVSLVELNLDDNRISELQSGVFKYLTELRILTLQRNLLSELVPKLFYKLGKLHVLKISGNQFDELDPEVFKDIPELRVLECRSCGLRRINTQIYHLLPYLSHLDLGDNRMQFIASDEFHDLRRLRSLLLDGNLLPVVLERTFVRQHELKYLCLARNRLAKITDTAFLNLSSLVDLDIGHNKLDRLEAVAVTHVAGTLQRLVLGGNGFGVDILRTVLEVLRNVRDLEMARMGLKMLPTGLLPDAVRRLNVSFNNLTELEADALPKELVTLDIRGNKLQAINEPLALRLSSLHSLFVAGNPWNCRSCHLGPVQALTNRTDVFTNVTCASPKTLKGQLLPSVRLPSCDAPDRGRSLDGKVVAVLATGALLALLLVGVVLSVACARKRITNAAKERKRMAEIRHQENSLDRPVAIFAKGEISFKFPLDLTERRVEVCTIDEIKKDTQTLPNGTGI